ncbi:YpjP family protein [Peribacillus sp. SCS-37]|uniref:YpjP family protein n=1 Tax=Paraperibacillus esterisolvens TaxID=3115296 RepID=UPI0039066B0B
MQLQRWIKKSLVILISLLTFGTITPSEFHWLQEANASKGQGQNKDSFADSKRKAEVESSIYYSRDELLQTFQQQAEIISYQKFGTKIKPRIEKEFKELILPRMELAIEQVSSGLSDEELQNLEITENPAGGSGERIFNITSRTSGNTLVKFHVRREQPPLEGYWFNFHYHTAKDQFASHHDLGRIYWDKNTPPNWNTTAH